MLHLATWHFYARNAIGAETPLVGNSCSQLQLSRAAERRLDFRHPYYFLEMGSIDIYTMHEAKQWTSLLRTAENKKSPFLYMDITLALDTHTIFARWD